MEIDFLDETEQVPETYVDLLNKLLQYAAEKEEVDASAELSVTFVTNERIQEINRDYRGKDSPTDVISFALEEEGEGEPAFIHDEGPRILGDIIISVDKAKEQAEDYGHTLEREMGFLSVHGLLHLLGYDHMTEEDEKIMFTRQEEILNEFGLKR